MSLIESLPPGASAKAGGSTRKYFLYAIGEILLIMIGILLALQLNNVNTKRIERNLITTYFKEINEELTIAIRYEHDQLSNSDSLISKLTNSLNALNDDDILNITSLENNLGALGTAWTDDLTIPIYREFIDEGMLVKVQDPGIKELFREVNQRVSELEVFDKLISTQYLNTIEPYMLKLVNYSRVALPQYKKYIIQGGPSSKHNILQEDLEFWNMLTIKLEVTHTKRKLQTRLIHSMETLKSKLGEKLGIQS